MTLIFDLSTPDDIRQAWMTAAWEGSLKELQRQAAKELTDHLRVIFSPGFNKAAAIVATRWPLWREGLLSDDPVVDIDVTEYADNPEEGEGGEHMMWLNTILVFLSGRSWEWAQPWTPRAPQRRWISRFRGRPRSRDQDPPIPKVSLQVVTR